jgi:hypothetical protein
VATAAAAAAAELVVAAAAAAALLLPHGMVAGVRVCCAAQGRMA